MEATIDTAQVRRWRRYEGMKDSGSRFWGDIPESWSITKLRHFVPDDRQIMYGIVLPGPHVNDGVPIVKGGNCEPGKLKLELLSRTSHEIESGYEKSRLREDDIVYAIRGSIGNAQIVPAELKGANLTQDAARIAPKPDINVRWLLYTVQSDPFFAKLEAGALGATIKGINIRDLKRADIPEVPCAEQRAIAAFLDRETARIDALIGHKQRLIALLEEKRQAVISHAVTKGLDPNVKMKDSGVEWLTLIPNRWIAIPLKFLVELKSGEGITGESITDVGEFPVYGGNGFRGFTSSYTHDGHYVLIGRQGAHCGNVNYANGRFWATEHAVVAMAKQKFDTIWLGETLRAMNLNQYSMTAAQPGLSMQFVGNLRVPVPPPEEQVQLTAFLLQENSKIDSVKIKLLSSIEKLQEYRTALISAAVTGQIDVREEMQLDG